MNNFDKLSVLIFLQHWNYFVWRKFILST